MHRLFQNYFPVPGPGYLKNTMAGQRFKPSQVDLAIITSVIALLLLPEPLIDEVIDGNLLLNGALMNITDPIQATVETNYRYRSDYSFVSLGLKSYTQQTDVNHSLTLSVKLSNIANLNRILEGIPLLGPVLNITIKGLIGNITVSVPISLPLLGADDLSSGSWKTPPVKY